MHALATIPGKEKMTNGVEEQEEEEAEENKKRHLNLVFIGHVGMSN